MTTPIKVPFVNLGQQFKDHESEFMQAFTSIGRSGNYIMGEALQSFETKAAEFCEVKHAIGVANGSDALFLIYKALGIGPGDEVITAANSFIATAWTIVAVGAKLVLVDVGDDLNINPSSVEAAITARTKAIVPVHLTGRPANIDHLTAVAKAQNLHIIEDAAQSIGARFNGRRVGSLGVAAAFSLHPLKNLGVFGDGGLITTNDDNLDKSIRLLRNHGLRNRDECQIWGYNSRLDTMQAGFAEIKLKYLDKWNEKCRKIAHYYRNNLQKFVITPFDKVNEYAVYHNFVIICGKERDELMYYLTSEGIETKIHYPIPIHLQNAAETLGYARGDFPATEKFAKCMVSLPIYPELTQIQIDHVVSSIKKFYERS